MPPKLGILAGGGELPARVIETCRESGREHFVIAFEGQADPEVVARTSHAWVRIGAAGKTVKLLRQAGVEELVMVGRIERPSLAALRPDGWAASFLARTGAGLLGDDGLLSALVGALEAEEGFRVVGVDSLVPELLATEGVYGALEPDPQALSDIERGVDAACAIGALDIGQAVVVRQGRILAVEAVEGTDAMLERCAGPKQGDSGGVLVKVSKPGQEERVDLPAVGVSTVEKAAAAGLKGIAVEAGATLVIDRKAMVEAADSAGLFVLGVIVGERGEGGSG